MRHREKSECIVKYKSRLAFSKTIHTKEMFSVIIRFSIVIKIDIFSSLKCLIASNATRIPTRYSVHGLVGDLKVKIKKIYEKYREYIYNICSRFVLYFLDSFIFLFFVKRNVIKSVIFGFFVVVQISNI